MGNNSKKELTEGERAIIERAKNVLMTYLGLSEPQAHRYIEKHAMDFRKTKVEIAEGILQVYEI